MPLYEYECRKCGHRFEKIQKFSDPPPKSCPNCNGKVRKLPSAPAIQFKGTGWYITDYARKSSQGTAEKEDKASADREKSSKGAEEKTSKEQKASKKEEKISKDKKNPGPQDSKKKGSGD